MALSINRKILEEEFQPEELTTFSTAVVAGLQHEPSTRFLCDIGIPTRPNPWFDFVDGSPEQVKTLSECYNDIHSRWSNLPEGSERWLLLGLIPYDDIALDGITGAIYCLPGDQSDVYLLNQGLVSFCHFLFLLERERPYYDFESERETLDPEGAFQRLSAQMRKIDPIAMAVSHSNWYRILDYIAYPESR
ncbi:SUKH-4 immunity protein [Dactylonectria macrodidyma]|uniref:SUKH-4 immunity protein n=1 Tax=Dactylonectria macrodidyma TaxID=307937 RepID=A0A9P9IJM7_9HYPO|nr:SUKH-4 immunity protein [Dactylonectria macrodidyma]